MKIKGLFGKICKTYLFAYTAAALYAGIDANFFNPNIRNYNDAEIEGIERKFEFELDGREKHLTLYGEIHFYNKKEYENGLRLMEQNRRIANEVGMNFLKSGSSSNVFYERFVSILDQPVRNYYQVASGRVFPTISQMQHMIKRKYYALEDIDSRYEGFSLKDKICLFGESLSSFFLAPLAYFEVRYDTIMLPRFRSSSYRNTMITSRDKVMAQNILKLLSDEKSDSLLATPGRAHVEGIVKNLSDMVELKEIK